MSKARFGVLLPDFPDDDSRGHDYVQKIDGYIASLDEAYESVWLGDHLIPWGEMDRSIDVLECMTTLSYFSGRYPDLAFGPITLASSFRNPALLAKITSTLSVLSNGKFILGIGAGWYEEEYRQYGYEYPSAVTRIKQMEEAMQITKLLWTEDEVTFNGKYYVVENAYCNPKPDPLPPIMIGGGGENYTLKAVARQADWWNGVFYNIDTWNHKLDVLQNHCDNVGRDYNEILKTAMWGIAIADTDEEAQKIAETCIFYPRGLLVGCPETLVQKIGTLIDAGVEYFQLYFALFPNINATKKFAEEVITQLK